MCASPSYLSVGPRKLEGIRVEDITKTAKKYTRAKGALVGKVHDEVDFEQSKRRLTGGGRVRCKLSLDRRCQQQHMLPLSSARVKT